MTPGARHHEQGGPGMLHRAAGEVGRRLLGTVTHVRTDEPVVALTFDDGPHPVFTPALLDLLARHGARATFFVIGERVAAYPAIARRAVDEGHTLANHTWSHRTLPELRGGERRREIGRCARAIAPLGGARLFRPPQGRQSLAARLDLARAGYTVVAWNAHADDWRLHDAGWMAERLRARLRPGGIALLHDALAGEGLEAGVSDRGPLLAAVELFLTSAAGRLRCVTVPELLRLGTPVRANWYRP